VIEIFMVIVGLCAYHCRVMIDQHQAGISKNPLLYVKNRPVKVVLSALGAVSGYLIAKEGLPPTLNGGVALGAYLAAGLTPYAIFDKYSKHAKKPETPEKTSEQISEDTTIKFHKLPKEDTEDLTRYWKEK